MPKPVNPESLSHEYRQQIQDLRDYQKMPDRVSFANRIKKIAMTPQTPPNESGYSGQLKANYGSRWNLE